MGEREGGQEGDERQEPRDVVRLVLATLPPLALAFLSVLGARFMGMYRETGCLDLGALPFCTRVLVSRHPALYVSVYGLAAAALVAKDFLLRNRLLVRRINVTALWLGATTTVVYLYALFRPIMGPGHGL